MTYQNHTLWMKTAIGCASVAYGRTGPNPSVGAVLVLNEQMIASGYHRRAGLPHAEIEAITQALSLGHQDLSAMTLYVTLEPCAHHGKTGPCVDAIIQAGIRHVVYGCIDPNPLVAGRGIAKLKAQKIKVEGPVLEPECLFLIRDFVLSQQLKRPFVSVKVAISLDGKIATSEHESQWITGAQARQVGRSMRLHTQVMMVGVNTIIHDNPRLSARQEQDDYEPLRVIVDSKLRTPLNSVCLNDGRACLLLTTHNTDSVMIDKIKAQGHEVFVLPNDQYHWVDMHQALKDLYHKKGISQLLVEGGGRLIGRLMELDLVDELHLFVAPIIIGEQGLSFIQTFNAPHLALARVFNLQHQCALYPDVHLFYTARRLGLAQIEQIHHV